MLRLAPTTLLLLAACPSDLLLGGELRDPEPVFPVIRVEPRLVAFGDGAAVGDTRSVTVSNDGTAPLEVVGFDRYGADAFELVGAPPPWDLVPGASRTFDVRFAPTADGVQVGFLEVVSDDERSPAVRVDLLGAVAPPRLLVAPDPLAFGEVLVPCGEDAEVTVSNGGDVPLRVEDARLEHGAGGGLALLHPAALSATLAPGASLRVPLRWDPPTPGPLHATLVLTSDDTLPERRVAVSGRAAHAREVEQAFVTPGKPAVDVVFAVDQSTSMANEQALLAAEFEALRQILEDAETEWRVAVVTGATANDQFCFSFPVLRPDTPDWGTAFLRAVTEPPGGWYTERLTEAVAFHLWDPVTEGVPACNAGLDSPPGTPLSVIIVSDEADQSVQPWEDSLAAYRRYAGAGAPVVVHAVVDAVPGPPLCAGPHPGTGPYADIVAATGGLLLDVCNVNWASQLHIAFERAVADLDLVLLDDPEVRSGEAEVDEASLRVFFDGVEQTSGWTYDDERRGVRFAPRPPPGTAITLTYGLLAACP